MKIQSNNEYPKILNEFISKIRTDKKSENTISSYASWIYEFIQSIKKIKKINNNELLNDVFKNITINDIEKYKSLLTKQGNNGNSINRKLASCKTFYKFLVQKNIVDSNIFINVDRVHQSEKERKPLTIEEVKKLLTAIQNSNDTFKERNYFLFLLYLDVAAREFELIDFKMDQLHYDKENKECYLVLNGKGDKQRIVYLSDMAIKPLDKYLEYRKKFLEDYNFKSDYLFISRQKNNLSSTTVLFDLKKYAKEAGLNETEISVHCLRHTSATLKYENGADLIGLQDFLGHSSPTTTKRYVRVSEEKRKKLANTMPSII